MRVLVTGANGQLGREIRRVSIGSVHEYVFVSSKPDGDAVVLDVKDPVAIREFATMGNFDVIVNCAAYTDVEAAENDYNTAQLLNNKLPAVLASVAKSTGAVLMHFSTDYIFKGDENVPYKETSTTSPNGVYATTKLMGEKQVQLSGCKYFIFRTSWMHSPHGNNFVKTMRRLTGERSSLKVVYDQIGTPTFARDLAQVVCMVIEKNLLDKTGIYNYSNEGVCSWYDFACEICNMSMNMCDIQPCLSHEYPTKVRRPHYSVLDKSKIKDTFGIEIPNWRDSLAKCIAELDAIENVEA